MKHRILLSLLLLIAATTTTRADDVKYLVIQYKTAAEPLVIALADEPVLTFSGDDMIVTEQKNGATTTYTVPMAEIASAPLVDDPTGIKAIMTDKNVSVTAGNVYLTGMKPGAQAAVYTISGAVVRTAKAGADGVLSMDISSLPQGTYVIKTPVGSLKVRR